MSHDSKFLDSVYGGVQSFVPPVQSLTDVDFYKFTMGQLIFRKYADTEVTFKVIVRDKKISLASVIDEGELRKALDHALGLRFSRTDLYYLRGMDVYGKNMFGEDYLEFLRNFQLPSYNLDMTNHKFELTFTGPWAEVTFWETIALAIISELYYRGVMRRMSHEDAELVYAQAKVTVANKLRTIAEHPGVTIADFGQRRRHSFLWQKWVVGESRRILGDQFVGSSNAWMAFNQDLVPIGTNAHELPMVLTALADTDDGMRYAQYQVLEDWQELYGQGLRVFLPDTYGTKQFLANVPSHIRLEDWRGMRQDSGDPIFQADQYGEWLIRRGVDPKERMTIFSDGLDVDGMVRLWKFFRNLQKTSFGWGTLLTNDFRGCGVDALYPFSIVCKVVAANGRPCVKLSDNPEKATGPADEVARYRDVFGTAEQKHIKVVV